MGLSPARLKAFVLNVGGGPDVEQARAFLASLGLAFFLEEIDAEPSELDLADTLRVIEDYKPLDVECAMLGLRLCRGIRERYPGMAVPGRRRWRRREPQGLPDRRKPRADDSQRRRQPDALSGGLGRREDQALAHLQRRAESELRAHLRAGARIRLRGLQPVHATRRLEVAEGIPFAALTGYDVPTLYALKGEIVRRGVQAVTGSGCQYIPSAAFSTARAVRGRRPAAAARQTKAPIAAISMASTASERARPSLDPWRHQGVESTPNRMARRTVVRAATLFLTGSECPWRCVMCDLWRYTTLEDTPVGAIPHQIADALASLRETPIRRPS